MDGQRPFLIYDLRFAISDCSGTGVSPVCLNASSLELTGKMPVPLPGRAGLVSFLLKDVHAHDVVTLADQTGVALRGGHHCTQPLMHRLGVESTARASFYFYNTKAEVARFVEAVKEIQKFFGQ
jgi:selenocysteine lyase/cysteine desulfurase